MPKYLKHILEYKLITQQKRRKSCKKDWDFTRKPVRFSCTLVYIELNYASYTKRASATFTCDTSIYETPHQLLQSSTSPFMTKAAVGKSTHLPHKRSGISHKHTIKIWSLKTSLAFLHYYCCHDST